MQTGDRLIKLYGQVFGISQFYIFFFSFHKLKNKNVSSIQSHSLQITTIPFLLIERLTSISLQLKVLRLLVRNFSMKSILEKVPGHVATLRYWREFESGPRDKVLRKILTAPSVVELCALFGNYKKKKKDATKRYIHDFRLDLGFFILTGFTSGNCIYGKVLFPSLPNQI